jgi:hypothetical protein
MGWRFLPGAVVMMLSARSDGRSAAFPMSYVQTVLPP